MIGKILQELRKSKRLSVSDLASQLDLKPRTYQSYESEEREPNIATINKLADFYGVSTDFLLGRESPPPMTFEQLLADKKDMSELEKRFILVYIRLDKKHRDAFVKALEDAAYKEEPLSDREYVYYPVMPNLASAGLGYELEESEAEEHCFVKPEDDINGDFAVRITGDSMEPDYPDGCYVLVRRYDDGEYPDINDVALFRVLTYDDTDAEGFIKVWKGDNILHSINPAYKDIQPPTVIPVGEVVGIIARA